MKRLLVVIVVFALGYSAYWAVGARGARAGFETWFDARRAEGWQADYTALDLKGFPNRFDTTLTRPVLADPETGLSWQAPFLQIFALAYRPNHIIAVWPKQQSFATPLARYDVTSDDLRASLVMGADTSLPLERSNLVASSMEVVNTATDQRVALGGVQVALHRVETTVSEYRLAVNVDGFAPPAPLKLHLDTGGALPDTLDALRADVTVGFDKPLDLSAIEQARPQPRRIRLRLAEARWGALELQFAGTLEVDETGRPTGRITVKARNWRDIIALAEKAGWLPGTVADQFAQGLGMVAGLSGNPETLDLPLSFGGGLMSLGPIPIGRAPVLRLR
ncbi:MAG: hypothetical protein CSA70_04495 [Rhodobacterales bacterium]|nr:MAG: hypothetical protein CSA70_04495 [Rhodobacterales bacterium]